MGIYLNPGNDLFSFAINSEIYVDKSMMLAETNKALNTEQRYIAVCRPRRFGKSMAANMLAAYYDRSCDSHDIFSDLKIAQAKTYEKYINSYDVIKINMQDFLSEFTEVDEMINSLQSKLLRELGYVYEEIREEKNLIDAFQWIYAYRKVQFVFILDEWDCVLREKRYDAEGHKRYLDFLRYLFKDKPYASLVYMTGILPIKKYGTHSALNIFNEYSMVNPGNYAQYTGFTEEEVITYCDKYHVDFDSMKEWYDGYYLRNIGHIYNPRAVVCALTSNSEFTSVLKYHDENSLTCVLSIAYFNAMKYYTRVYELPTGEGFADIAFIPKKNIDKLALLIELKYDKSAEGAIKQIKDKNYCSKLEDYKGNLLLVGINYDVKDRDYQCIIEKY